MDQEEDVIEFEEEDTSESDNLSGHFRAVVGVILLCVSLAIHFAASGGSYPPYLIIAPLIITPIGATVLLSAWFKRDDTIRAVGYKLLCTVVAVLASFLLAALSAVSNFQHPLT